MVVIFLVLFINGLAYNKSEKKYFQTALFCSINSPKPKGSRFMVLKDKKNKKQPIFMFDRLETETFGICLKKI